MTRTLLDEGEQFIATLARLFVEEGKAREVAVLASGKASVKITDYDNWDGGTDVYTIFLEISPALYSSLGEERETVEKALAAKAGPQLSLYEKTWLKGFVIVSEIVADADWREKANAWVKGSGVTNQGRVRSDNVASRTCDGLLFRSQPEIFVYQAVKSLGLSFAPLPVFLRGGATYQRIEPDFVIFHKGVVVVVEVDGDTIHRELPAEAYARTTMLENEGARIVRVLASHCDTLEKAQKWAAELPALIDRLKASK